MPANQMKSLINSLSLAQKISIVAAVVLVVGSLVYLAHWNRERDFKVLYSSLASEDAGAMIAKLKEGGTEYRVSDSGDAILVPSARVAEIRLQLAAAGLPKSGRIGYELFDKNNFGATDFAEQINYHRALEGELERSIMSLDEVERARVHLTFAKESLFLEQRQPAKASVMVKLKTGRQLPPANVLAITHLVASAVEGLAPQSVAVVDMTGTLLNRPRRADGPDGLDGSEASLEFRRSIEKDLLAKINSTLEPLLGAEKYRAGVSVECDFASGEQSEETFDPNRSVMVTSQKTEDLTSGASSGGVPGAASNLPRPAGRTGSNTGNTRRTESIAYQSSRTVKRLKIPQGTLRRMSVAILLDQGVRWEGTGPKARRVLEPPSADKIKVIRDLVAGATGLQSERGDQLTVETLPFEATLLSEPPGSNSSPAPPSSGFQMPRLDFKNPRTLMILGGVGLGVLLLLGGLLLLVMKMRKGAKTKGPVDVKAPKEIAAPQDAAAMLQHELEHRLAEQDTERQLQAKEVLASLKLPSVKTKKTEVLSKQILEEAKKDPQAIAHVLRAWMIEKSNDR
jgi:flagellar M-ring protein FliF